MYDFYIFSTLLTFLFTFFLGVFTYVKGREKIFNIYWALVSFSCSFWSLGLWGVVTSSNVASALLWQIMVDLSAMFIPFFFLMFSIHFVGRKKKTFYIEILSLIFLIILLFLSFTSLYKAGVAPLMLFNFWVVPGELYFLLPLFQFLVVSYGLWIFAKEYFKSNILRRKQLFFLIIISLIGFGGAFTNYFPHFFNLYPYGHILVVFYVLLTVYSIFKHQLMDIKLVLRRSSVYLLSVSAVILLATGLKYVFSNIFSESGLLNELIIVFAAILSFPFIKDYFSYISNKYFFASLYNTQEVITRFSERLSTILDIEKLLESVASEINKTFYPKSFAIFLFNEKDARYYSAFSAGNSFSKRQIFDLSGNILNNYLGDGEILSLEEVKESSVDDFNIIQETFFNNDIKLVIPLSIKDRSIGLFLMGEKESGEAYNSEDIQLLQILSTQSAFALDNSLKYEEAKNFNILLEREVETAVMDLRKANEELRKLDTAKSDFISIASHQLRTPLTVIKGYISMILEGNFGKLPDTTRDPIEKIYDSNERLIKLVEQLLSISRIESGKIKYDFEEANLSEIIKEVIESVRYSAIKKGLDLSYSPPKGFEPLAMIDTAKIRQIITSMIDNSIKYTNKTEDKRGFILVRIEDLKEKDKLRVIVEDNGLGIREEDQGNLFKKFSRGADMSIVHTEGTGLGLYVAKQIIEAHKGEIYAESRGRDLGAKIYFDLPKIIKEN